MDDFDLSQADHTGPQVCDNTDIRAAESDHRIANSLSLTAALLRMQRQKSSDAALQDALLSAEARIISMARFHAYLHAHRAVGRVNLAETCAEILPEIGRSIGIECLLVVDNASNLDVSKRLAQKLLIIVNELALNALKHGYQGRGGGCISVELTYDTGGHIKLCIMDSGPGLPDSFDPENGAGLGLRIVSLLVMELGGTLTCKSSNGAQFTISIPVD